MASFFYFCLSSLSFREHFLAIKPHLFRSLSHVTKILSDSSWLATALFCNLDVLLTLVCISFPTLGLRSKLKKNQFSHHMGPYVPSQESAKWLSCLGWDLAEPSTWVRSVQREHWRAVLSGRVVCRPRLSVDVASGQQLVCRVVLNIRINVG